MNENILKKFQKEIFDVYYDKLSPDEREKAQMIKDLLSKPEETVEKIISVAEKEQNSGSSFRP